MKWWLALLLVGCAPPPVRPVAPSRCSPPGWVPLAGPHRDTAVHGTIGARLDLVIASVAVAGDAAPGFAPATHAGQRLREAPLADDLHRLWALGAFGDLRIEVSAEADGAHVRFVTTPRARVDHVEAGPAPELARLRALVGGAFEPVRIQRVAAAIEAAYVGAGYPDARIEVLEARARRPRGGVGLCIAASRGPHATIGAIHFPGAHAVGAAELLAALGPVHLGGTLSSDDLTYAARKVAQIYWNRGYANVRVDSSTARRGTSIEVQLAVTEGNVYHLGTVTLLDGTRTSVPPDLAAGELFSRDRIAAARDAIAKRVGADVQPETTFDLANRRIDLTFEVTR
ncbi:MAG: POTRA domain-containing protein [Kofleriaceae bacterium]